MSGTHVPSTTDEPTRPAFERVVSLDDPRLVLWLDASDASTVHADPTGRVIAWDDRSLQHNDMKATYSYDRGPRVAPQPRITLEPIGDGLAALHFAWTERDVGSLRIASGGTFNASVSIDAADWLILAIAAHANTRDGLLFAAVEDRPRGFGPCLFAGEAALGTSGFTLENKQQAWNDNAFHAYAFAIDDRRGTSRLYVDGTVTELEMAPSLGARMPRQFVVGAVHHAQQCAEGCWSGEWIDEPLDGSIAELMVFRAAIGSAKDLAFLRAYVGAKYGLSL